MHLERKRLPDGSAVARHHRLQTTDYSLSCKAALTAYVIYGNVAIDNNHIENFTRPKAMPTSAPLPP